jgi:hypothetical protein
MQPKDYEVVSKAAKDFSEDLHKDTILLTGTALTAFLFGFILGAVLF